MKLYYTLKKNISLLVLPAVLFSLVSCGSYQYSGYETDGIYGESRPGIWEEEQPQSTQVKPNGDNSYYKNLFAQQSQMYGEILDGDVFTDVDSYSSNDGYDNYSEVGGDVAYVGGNAPWGQDPDSYTVNIYNNGPGFLYGYGPGYRLGWGRNLVWGYGFNRIGYWNTGFFNPFFYDPFPLYGDPFNLNYGLTFGYGHQLGFINSPYFRNYGYNRHYGNPYYGYGNRGNNVAYSRSRRDYNNYRNNNNRSSYSRSIREIRNSQSGYSSSRVRSSANNGYNDSRVYSRTSRRTVSPRTMNSGVRGTAPAYERSSRSNNNTYRSSPSRRSSSSSNSRSVRSSSSSSSSRSSGSTTRSSSSRTSRGGRGGR